MVRQHALMESLSANLHGVLHQIDFLFYRLLTGVTEAINACFYLRRDLL